MNKEDIERAIESATRSLIDSPYAKRVQWYVSTTSGTLIPLAFVYRLATKADQVPADAPDRLRRLGFEVVRIGENPGSRSFWWVNHKQTHRVELLNGYIWSPKTKKNGDRNQAYINLTLVRPGDIIVSYADSVIKAIGVATSNCEETDKPLEYGTAGSGWDSVGWKVLIDWRLLPQPIRPRDCFDQIQPLLPVKYSPLQHQTGYGNQSIYLSSISSELGRLMLELAGEECSELVLEVANRFRADISLGRLPVSTLQKVTPLDLWQAVQDLKKGNVDALGFGASTDYDLLLEDGSRLAPKAVFGLAATRALGFEVQPRHFTAGVGSPCFQILQRAGYLIVPKDERPPEPDPLMSDEDRTWTEGRPVLVSHLRKERAAGLAKAKKVQFRNHYGALFCERCFLKPEAVYGEAGDACIEVHHAAAQVSEMEHQHQTKLDDLQCLCANCHRIVHRLLKNGKTISDDKKAK